MSIPGSGAFIQLPLLHAYRFMYRLPTNAIPIVHVAIGKLSIPCQDRRCNVNHGAVTRIRGLGAGPAQPVSRFGRGVA